jgi:hypothetical protein
MPLRDGFAVLASYDRDAPELLHAPLNDGLGHDIHPSGAHGAQEVGCIVHAHGKLPLRVDGGRGANAGDALDGGRIDATMNDTSGRVMLRPKLQMRRHARARFDRS